jgi:ribonuclease Z
MYIHAHQELYPILKSVLKFDPETWMYEVIVVPLQFNQPEVIFEDNKIKVSSFPLRHSIPVSGFLFEEKPRQRKIKKDAVTEFQLSIKEINELKNGHNIERNGQTILNEILTKDPLPVRKYAFATDTLKCSEIAAIIQEADLFYHEATYTHQDLPLARKTCHSTARQAAEIALLAGAGKLLVGHYSSRYTDIKVIENEARSIFPNSIAVNDGDIYTIGF